MLPHDALTGNGVATKTFEQLTDRIKELESYVKQTLKCANNGKDIGLCPQCRETAETLIGKPPEE